MRTSSGEELLAMVRTSAAAETATRMPTPEIGELEEPMRPAM